MDLNGKRVDLELLEAELAAASIPVLGLCLIGDELLTYDATGALIDLPPLASAVIDAHVEPTDPPVPVFGSDTPTDREYLQQAANVVSDLRAYLALPSPTNAQTITAFRLVVRVVLYLIRQQVVRYAP
jgi:hypothetical protein